MIVKNEAHCIRRCLDSVLPWIDGWVIVDTGSTDGTQGVIREHMRGVPGALFERPWVYQVANRNEALGFARKFVEQQFGPGDSYALLLDADEELVGELDLPTVGVAAYELMVRHRSATQWPRTAIVRMNQWDWAGKRRHPYMKARGPVTQELVTTAHLLHHADGASWQDPEKYQQYVRDMQADLADDPDNPRLTYYLAQSHKDAGQLVEAIEVFERRAVMGGWEEEGWYASYQAACLRDQLGQPAHVVEDAYRKAAYRRPHRPETWFRLAKWLRGQQRPDDAVKAARRAVIAAATKHEDRLFVEQSVYDWIAMGELAMCLYSAGDPLMALMVMLALEGAVPEKAKAWAEGQIGWFMSAVHAAGK